AAVRRRVELPVRVHRARERTDDDHRRAVSRRSVDAPSLARARARAAARCRARGRIRMSAALRRTLPSLAVIVLVVMVWWSSVCLSARAIFPTPWQVVAGTAELVRKGTLWAHIGASLFRVGTGFALAVLVGLPLGLWMGWVRGAFATLNPLFQILRPISP